VGADPGKLRIAFTTITPGGTPLHPDCVKAVDEAARLCGDLGHIVTEAAPKIDGGTLVPMFMTLWSAGCTWTIDSMALYTKQEVSAEKFEPATWALYQMGRQQSGSSYLLALQWLQRISREVARFMEDFDVWLTPTLGEPPLPLGSFNATPENPMAGMRKAAEFVPFTPICNSTGQPAMSVPLFWNDEGLPIGTHFVGRFGDEATLFRLAGQLETARPWSNRRPPVSAA